MSIAIYGLYGFPKVFLLLSVQSLVVVTMALWFRNRLMVIMNSLLFIMILLVYLFQENIIITVKGILIKKTELGQSIIFTPKDYMFVKKRIKSDHAHVLETVGFISTHDKYILVDLIKSKTCEKLNETNLLNLKENDKANYKIVGVEDISYNDITLLNYRVIIKNENSLRHYYFYLNECILIETNDENIDQSDVNYIIKGN